MSVGAWSCDLPLAPDRSRHLNAFSTRVAARKSREVTTRAARAYFVASYPFLGQRFVYPTPSRVNTILRNIAAVIGGFVLGSVVNMALITASPHIIPPPPGVDVSNVASMKASMHLYEAKHFLFPFLAHALGTLVGALVAFVVAGSRRSAFAYTLGLLFLVGGIVACGLIPAPTWFMILDLVAAYLPMAWLATRLGRSFVGNTPVASAS